MIPSSLIMDMGNKLVIGICSITEILWDDLFGILASCLPFTDFSVRI